MDRRANLAAVADSHIADPIDQAVFTSIRTATARGYRLVAASAGLSEDERREIVQRAPSHDNMTDPSPAARAAACWALRSGRIGVMFARHAEPESSGRGGLRVHTHVLVLAAPAFRRLGCDPFRIARSCEPALDEASKAVPQGEIPALRARVELGAPRLSSVGSIERQSLPGLLAAYGQMLIAAPTLVYRMPNPTGTLATLLALLPPGVRRGVSFACGMKPSPQRCFRLLVDAGETAAAFAHDHAYATIDWMSPAAFASHPYAAWVDFVRTMIERGRGAIIPSLIEKLGDDVTPGCLARIAAENAVTAVSPTASVPTAQPPKPAAAPSVPPRQTPPAPTADNPAPRQPEPRVSGPRADRPPRPANLRSK